MESAECRGINPGAFHIILANKIAIRDEGFIADVTRDLEVWNQAVFGYRSKVISERTSNFSPMAAPNTVKELRVVTVMDYTIEIGTLGIESSAPHPTLITLRIYPRT